MSSVKKVLLATHPLCLEHDPGIGQPEHQFRLQAILRALKAGGYSWEDKNVPIALKSIAAVHSDAYLKKLDQAVGRIVALEEETFTSEKSVEAAYMSASVACSLVEKILSGDIFRGFALTRPPGHHAGVGGAMGYCIINNIAVAAEHAFACGAKRVLILDFDVHHGNGTQEIVSGDERVVHIDIHENSLFPDNSGPLDFVGKSPAEGNIINIPLPMYCGGIEYLCVLKEVVLPVATSFSPDIILVSAGYDAHEYDGLSSMRLTYVDYYEFTKQLCRIADSVCGGKIMFTLEGGYSVAGLESSVLATVAAMHGDSCPEIPTYPLRPKQVFGFDDMLGDLHKKVLQPYWRI